MTLIWWFSEHGAETAFERAHDNQLPLNTGIETCDRLSFSQDSDIARVLMLHAESRMDRIVDPGSFIVGLLQNLTNIVHVMPVDAPWYGTLVLSGTRADVDETLRLSSVQSVIDS